MNWHTLDEVAAKIVPPLGWRDVLRAYADLKPEVMHVVIKPGFKAQAQDIDGKWQEIDPVLLPRVFGISGTIPIDQDRTRAEFVLREMMLADDAGEPITVMNPLTDLERGWEIRTIDRMSPSAVRLTEDEARLVVERLSGHVPAAKPVTPRQTTKERNQSVAEALDEIEAKAKEVGAPFSRESWPGTYQELRGALSFANPDLTYRLPADIKDLVSGFGVKCHPPGRSKTKGVKFYRSIFPDYPA